MAAAMGDAAWRGLPTRAGVGGGLIVIAVAALVAGGLAFTALVSAAVLLISAEWSAMGRLPRAHRLASLAALALIGLITVGRSAGDALIVLGAVAGVLGIVARALGPPRAAWVAGGLLYAGLPMVALLWLRALPDGIARVAWLFAVVWATDIGAFFAGRAIGGPRLAPAISPNKTWAGVAGGVAAATLVAGLVSAIIVHLTGFAAAVRPLAVTALRSAVFGAVVAVVAIIGDLFESWLKRRAGVKDSGKLLPGHGGVMDRLDGLVPAAVVVAAAALGGV